VNHIISRLCTAASIVALVSASLPLGSSAQTVADTEFLATGSWLAEHSTDPTITVVDMRPAQAYSQGHIPGALSVPYALLAQPNSDESQIVLWETNVMDQLGSVGIEPSQMVVSYDDSGNLYAARMRWVLKYFGQPNAAVLDGGLPAWTQLGEPITTEATTRGATTYVGTPHPELLATWQDVLDRIDNPDVQIVDARPEAAYSGEATGSDLHTGHIPGALNLDWNTLVQADVPRPFKSPSELQATLDSIGLTRDKEIIVYCGSGVAGSEVLFALQMLDYPQVRLYSASWAEWGNREDLPFVTGPDPGA
jgi:thiosulfate/3-mercaptopyruvate sulfurtransferase